MREVTLARPERSNALSIVMMEDMAAALDGAADARASLVVIRAEGERVFCAGADMDEISGDASILAAWERAFTALAVAIERCAAPTLCRLHGQALGGGIAIAGLCDVVIAQTGAKLSFAEIRLGVYPAMVHAALAGRIDANLLYQYCMGARRLGAVDALRAGLVTEIADEFETRIAYYAERSEAILLGRALRNGAGPDVEARLAAVAPRAAAHFRSPQVRSLIAKYSRSNRTDEKIP